jgi:hypothetical protein
MVLRKKSQLPAKIKPGGFTLLMTLKQLPKVLMKHLQFLCTHSYIAGTHSAHWLATAGWWPPARTAVHMFTFPTHGDLLPYSGLATKCSLKVSL